MTTNLVELLYRALDAEVGIAVRTSDVALLRNRLYLCRRQAQNPDFEALTFSPSRTNPESELWILRNNKG